MESIDRFAESEWAGHRGENWLLSIQHEYELSFSVADFRVPVARRLASPPTLLECFGKLSALPHCAWLDAASDHQFDRGRYSFLTADPVAWCEASMDAPDPWPVLTQWCHQLTRCASEWVSKQLANPSPTQTDSESLPPFCGGIVGVLAYESVWWLEPSLRPQPETNRWLSHDHMPGMAIGLYDWTIAVDHQLEEAWLLSTGLNELFEVDIARANERADEVQRRLELPPTIAIKTSELQDEARNELPGEATSDSLSEKSQVSSNFTDESYQHAVAEVVRRIRAGDSFQVNLAQTLSHPSTCTAPELYQRLRTTNPAPYAGYFDAGRYQVLSSSPEGFLQVRDNVVVTRPIKGTVPRTGNATEDERLGETLLQSEKDRAENTMIVDLMRNDLSRVCADASVEVTGLCELEKYQRVQHLVSTVRGTLRDDIGVADLLAACFPGGSITGAPKIEAMRTIAQLEGRPRGPYCGSMGYISLDGSADFNILIRTVTQRVASQLTTTQLTTTQSTATQSPPTQPITTRATKTDQTGPTTERQSIDASGQASVWEFPVGGGITARSNPQRETEETWTKAAGMIEAITTMCDASHQVPRPNQGVTPNLASPPTPSP
ncbi:aminodeoxychorismate synthase, subunit I [Neorhodopirellula lusitana]|uniref:Aminodeoxychorismate synthase, subunit I n=1 Tax=Neorhodopirellula lusitana TaxID=445327 RepID=A0ABY1Q223_9BACT|nr:anthranilate synthase component I family protein [Neorhodopirellula lusitana]SMP56986.1 aminodeoxychorismate synthase, subunit I [Neorhodopirellula lusitana]